MRTTLFATAGITVCLVPLMAAAAVASPAGGCPTSYQLVAISDIPAEGQPGATAIDSRGNADGYVCLLAFNEHRPGAPFNGVDNRVQGR